MDSGTPPPQPKGDFDHPLTVPPPRRPPRVGCLGRGGCGAGCLGVTLLLLVLTGGFVNWLLGESPIIPAETLLSRRTTSFAIVHVDEQDPGVRALLHTLVGKDRAEAATGREQGSLEAWWRRLLTTQTQSFLPMQILLLQDAGDHPTMVVSFPHAGFCAFSYWNMRRYALDHGAHASGGPQAEILALPPDIVGPAAAPGSTTFVAIVSNNVVLSTDAGHVLQMLAALGSAGGQFAGNPAQASLYHRLNSRQDMLGVLGNDHGEVRRLLQQAARSQAASRQTTLPLVTPEAIEAAAAGVQAVAWEIDLLGEDEMDAHLVAACRNEPFAAEARAMLEQVGDALVKSGMARSRTVVVDGRLVDAHLRVVRLRDLLR